MKIKAILVVSEDGINYDIRGHDGLKESKYYDDVISETIGDVTERVGQRPVGIIVREVEVDVVLPERKIFNGNIDLSEDE